MLASMSNTLAIYMPFWEKRHRFGIPSIDESYSFPLGGGGGGNPCDDLYGEALPEWGTFSRLQVYERVGILLIKLKY